MIDPVRTGPVSPIAATVAKGADAPLSTPQPVRVQKPLDAAPGVTLPRLLDLVADLANSGPPLDYAKIAQVRRAIADGSYKIDADALAKSIMSFDSKD